MGKSKYSVDQVIRILTEAELPGVTAASVARKYGVCEQTITRWRKKYRGMDSSDAKRLQVLEEENRRLKKILAEKELEIQMLSEVIKKNF